RRPSRRRRSRTETQGPGPPAPLRTHGLFGRPDPSGGPQPRRPFSWVPLAAKAGCRSPAPVGPSHRAGRSRGGPSVWAPRPVESTGEGAAVKGNPVPPRVDANGSRGGDPPQVKARRGKATRFRSPVPGLPGARTLGGGPSRRLRGRPAAERARGVLPGGGRSEASGAALLQEELFGVHLARRQGLRRR